MPICVVCKDDLPRDDFSPNALERGRGYQICRACANEKTKDYLRRNPHKRREYDAKYRNEKPEQYKAEVVLHSALKWGRLVAGPCSVCGITEGVEGHHFSYEPKDWLRVIWLCSLHHKQVHTGEIDWTSLPITHGEFPRMLRKDFWPDEIRRARISTSRKLSDQDVLDICEQYRNKTTPCRIMADRYGVTAQTIYRAIALANIPS